MNQVDMLEKIITEKDAVIDVLLGISGSAGRASYIMKLNKELEEKLCAANKTIEQMRADGADLIERNNLDNLELKL